MDAIDTCLKELAAALEPPPTITVSQWADAHRMLSSEASAEQGHWNTSRAEYQREIMDCLSPSSPYETVVLKKSSQIGGTEMLNNLIGFIVACEPGPVLVVQPRVEDAKAWSKDRLAPMIRDTPVLRGKVADVRTRDADNTVLHKRFSGGHITVAGANSPAGLAARPIRYVCLDDVDRYPVSGGTEGDPVGLAVKRSIAFWNRKIFILSTPTVKDASRIDSAYQVSDRRRFWVPCPLCGVYQTLIFRRLEWPEGDPASAAYRCEACEQMIEH